MSTGFIFGGECSLLFGVIQWSYLFSIRFLWLLSLGLLLGNASAQDGREPISHDIALPDAPQSIQQPNSPATNAQGTAVITGTVFDASQAVLQGAQLTLADRHSSTVHTAISGSNGQFAFIGLPPGVYRLTVTAPGMSTFNSADIALQAGENYIAPSVTLLVTGGNTTVTVSGNKEELAEQQVQIALQQRIGGVIPNFYSSYDWSAPPMEAKQKFHLGIRSVLDPVAFLSVAGLAGAEQYENVFPAYGSGFEGYGKRYGAAFANHAAGTLLSRAVFPSIFHQDPRYFYKGKGSVQSRAFYAIAAAVMARGDNGNWEPNYSAVLGRFSAAAVSNLYYPAADRGASLVLLNGLAGTGADAMANLIREFLLKKFTSHVPTQANGTP